MNYSTVDKAAERRTRAEAGEGLKHEGFVKSRCSDFLGIELQAGWADSIPATASAAPKLTLSFEAGGRCSLNGERSLTYYPSSILSNVSTQVECAHSDRGVGSNNTYLPVLASGLFYPLPVSCRNSTLFIRLACGYRLTIIRVSDNRSSPLIVVVHHRKKLLSPLCFIPAKSRSISFRFYLLNFLSSKQKISYFSQKSWPKKKNCSCSYCNEINSVVCEIFLYGIWTFVEVWSAIPSIALKVNSSFFDCYKISFSIILYYISYDELWKV